MVAKIIYDLFHLLDDRLICWVEHEGSDIGDKGCTVLALPPQLNLKVV